MTTGLSRWPVGEVAIGRHALVVLFTVGLLLFGSVISPLAAQAPSESSGGASVKSSAPPAVSKDASASQESSKDNQENAKTQKQEESVLENLVRDPYERRYGHPPGDGWIPMPGTTTELRFGGFVELNIIQDFQDTGSRSETSSHR